MYCVGVLISWAIPAASWPMAFSLLGLGQLPLHPLLLQERPPLFDGPADDQRQHVDEAAFEILDEIIADAQLHGLDGDLFVAGAGDHDRRRQRPVGDHGPNHFQAAQAGHGLIDDHGVIGLRRIAGQARHAVADDVDRVARPLQALLHQAGLGRVVLHVQQPLGQVGAPSGGEKTTMSSLNRGRIARISGSDRRKAAYTRGSKWLPTVASMIVSASSSGRARR